MPDSSQAESNPQNAHDDNKNSARGYMRQIVIYSVFAYLILLGLSIFWPNLTERTKFFTANGLVLALLIVAIVQVLIYRRQQVIMQKQWEAMDTQAGTMVKQLKAMEGTLTETQTMLEQNERAVSASERQASTMISQASTMQDQTTTMQESLKATERSIDIAEKSAIYAQRAYVTATVSSVVEFVFHLRIENSGNTPANEVVIAYSCGLREEEPDGNDIGFEREVRIGLIAPKAAFTYDANYGQKVPAKQIDLLRRERLKFYCWGFINYEDIFNEGRRTQFCFYQQPRSAVAAPCKRGNRAD
jgi:hypothetical protein